MKFAKALAITALAILSAVTVLAGTLTASAAEDVVVSKKAATKLIPGLNAYNSAAQGTLTKLTEAVDGHTDVLEIHTVDTALRALCGNGYGLKNGIYTGALRPGMRLEVMYKYVPDTTVAETDTPTDVATLLTQKPQIIVTSPNLNNGSNQGTIDARDNIVANTWTTAVFDLGNYVTYDNTAPLETARTLLLSKHGSGAATGTALAIEGGVCIHVDPKDILYVGTVKLQIDCQQGFCFFCRAVAVATFNKN